MARAAIDFGLGMDIAVRARFGYMAVISVHIVVALAAGMLARTLGLRQGADRYNRKKLQWQCQSDGNCEMNPYGPASSLNF